MKVWQVIEELQKFDKDLEVCTNDSDYGIEGVDSVYRRIMTYKGFGFEEGEEVVVITS